MSLILDALNKADHERRKDYDETPGLDSHHDDPDPQEENNRLSQFAIFGIAGLIVVSLAAGAFFWGKESSPPVPAPAAIAKTSPVTEAPKVPPVPAATPTPAAITKAQVTPVPKPTPSKMAVVKQAPPDIAALYEKPVDVPTPTPRVQPQQAPAAEIARIAAATKVAAIESPFEATGKSVASPPAAMQKPTPKPSRVPYPMMEDFTQIGTVRSLSWSTQEKIPSMTYSEHNYEQNDQGTVVINGEKYKKGGQISTDLTLEAVLYDGILLRYKGEVFKLQALSSWVNM